MELSGRETICRGSLLPASGLTILNSGKARLISFGSMSLRTTMRASQLSSFLKRLKQERAVAMPPKISFLCREGRTRFMRVAVFLNAKIAAV